MDALGGRITVLRAFSFSLDDIVNGLGRSWFGRRRRWGSMLGFFAGDFGDMYGKKAKSKGKYERHTADDYAGGK